MRCEHCLTPCSLCLEVHRADAHDPRPQCYVDTVGPAADYQLKLEGFFPTISFTVTSKADALFPIVSAASIVAKVTRDRILSQWQFAEPGVAQGDGAEERRLFGSGYPSGACLALSFSRSCLRDRLDIVEQALTVPSRRTQIPRRCRGCRTTLTPSLGSRTSRGSAGPRSRTPCLRRVLRPSGASPRALSLLLRSRGRGARPARALTDSPAVTLPARRADEPASIQKYFSGKAAGPERAALWKDYNLVSVGEF